MKMMHKEISCIFGKKIVEKFTVDELKDLANHFIESYKEIEYVNFNMPMSPDDQLPLYTVSNGKETILVFAIIEENEKRLMFEISREGSVHKFTDLKVEMVSHGELYGS